VFWQAPAQRMALYNVNIQVAEAKNLKDVETFGKMDPYCTLTLGANQRKTSTHRDGGTKPRWYETLTFNNVSTGSEGQQMRLMCYDQNTITDELIGMAEIKFSPDSICQAGGQGLDSWYNLYSPETGKVRGQVRLVIQSQRVGAPGAGQAQPQLQQPQMQQQQMQQQQMQQQQMQPQPQMAMMQAPMMQQQPLMMQQPQMIMQPQMMMQQPVAPAVMYQPVGASPYMYATAPAAQPQVIMMAAPGTAAPYPMYQQQQQPPQMMIAGQPPQQFMQYPPQAQAPPQYMAQPGYPGAR
jgi:hypothetical protein